MVIEVLQRLTAIGNHVFLPDSVSLLANSAIQAGELRRSSQVTDTYLLALAASVDAALATFDQRITTDAVLHGRIVLIA